MREEGLSLESMHSVVFVRPQNGLMAVTLQPTSPGAHWSAQASVTKVGSSEWSFGGVSLSQKKALLKW